ncbi:hypothetical protein [Hymenobacter koreensis]|uniref:Lipoprotein n=1 Tax=Hymenobacter koreensis TaxID=1084523 RepID=A0ABP8JIA3_9BACT
MNKRLGAACVAVLSLTAACRDQPQQQSESPRRMPVATAESVPAPAEVVPAPQRTCSIENTRTANEPFGPELSVADVLQLGGRISGREAVENNHEKGQMDTLLTLTHASNRFTFYRSPDKDLMIQATITNFEAPYSRTLRTRIEAARRGSTSCDSLVIADSLQMNTVSARLVQGQLRRVSVDPYYD